jgi:N-methylhydantoinase A
MGYICGTDIGGTFTDCIIADDEGKLISVKAPSTPKDFSQGIFTAIELAAERLGSNIKDLLAATDFLFHGATVATNAMVQRKGVKTGLITTRGFRDIIHIMRGKGRTTGVSINELLHVPTSNKPTPIVPKTLIEEVSERIDCDGKVVVPLNESELEVAVDRLLAQDVAAIAVGFLWSFKNSEHEKAAEDFIRAKAPHIFVTSSNSIAPKWGEYERITSSVVNCYIGPIVAEYLRSVENKAKALGYPHSVLIMQANGGVSNTDRVSQFPAFTFECGPVAGVAASAFQGGLMGFDNIITTDMGGTTFDVGLVHGGKAARSSISTIGQYEFFVPSVNVSSVGSGGGSIVWVEESSRTLKVGPLSAGAEPGPICYDRGGEEPTVTDADLCLGYINPDYFLGGRISLDRDKAEKAFERLGRSLGMNPTEVAFGSVRIVDYQMAELIRQVTIERGHDPRDFVIFAYGGAGPTHAGSYAKELGIKKVVIPMSNISSVWSAYGTAISDIVHLYEVNEILQQPFNLDLINQHLSTLRSQGADGLRAEGIPEKNMVLQLSVDMRYKAQVHVIEVPIPKFPLEEADLPKVTEEFESRYEDLYGKGTGYAAAGFEIFCMRCHAVGKIRKPEITKNPLSGKIPHESSLKKSREVYWDDLNAFRMTQIYDGLGLKEGNEIDGPAIIEYPDTTVLVHPGQLGQIDAYGNLIINLF